MPNNIVIGSFVLGAILLMVGLLGRRFALFGASIPGVANRSLRVASAIGGLAFVVLALVGKIAPEREGTDAASMTATAATAVGPTTTSTTSTTETATTGTMTPETRTAATATTATATTGTTAAGIKDAGTKTTEKTLLDTKVSEKDNSFSFPVYLSKNLEESTRAVDEPEYGGVASYDNKTFKRGIILKLREGGNPSVVSYRIPDGAKTFRTALGAIKTDCDPQGATVNNWIVTITADKDYRYEFWWYHPVEYVVIPVNHVSDGLLSIRFDPQGHRTCAHAILDQPRFER